MEKSGVVYKIKNKLTGKTYFGETTRDGETRLHEHMLALEKGVERNKSLQREFSKLGVEAFEFEVIIETKEHKLCELLLIELLSRIGLGYKQRRGDQIQKLLNGELAIPKEVYQEIRIYINQNHHTKDQHLSLLNELKDIKENGFQCKSDDIYNREFKNLFLRSYANSTRRVDEVRFKKACEYEKLAQKDLYDFTYEEAEDFITSLNSNSRKSILNQISRAGKYLEFAIQQGVSMNKVNYYKELARKWHKK
ncbi:GIY-YIG nuclease family protein [Bacillus infantis]|uniref:phage lytic cycle repressor MrpR family protein n=1 Tax=Bacillus infantis TaxID=324767 RepID=UPI0020A0CA5B|nr:GIY-YIG nuclease family protein [Bacillus infantis]MCP1160420.1 GIY-YIG nuclease family protein [Bacillus infantis]